jgi:hypothetical protein
MRPRSAAFALACSLALGGSLSSARLAHAQSDDDRATARALGQEGQAALDNKSYATAEDRFRRADKLVHAPTLIIGLARALAAEAKYVEAQEAYNRIIREGVPPGAPAAFKQALEDAKKEVEAVAPKLGTVIITVKASNGQDINEPKVTLDDRPVNAASLGVKRAVDPGPHTLHVSADGYKAAESKFAVLEGGSATQNVTLEKDTSAVAAAPAPAPGGAAAPAPGATPAPGPGAAPAGATTTTAAAGGEAPAPAKKSILPWVAFGVGGAGLLMGGITGLIAMGDHSSIAKDCPGGTCPANNPHTGDISGYHTMGTLSTVGFVIAGLGAAAGVVLLVMQPKDSGESAPAAPGAAPAPAPAPAAHLKVYPTVGLGTAGVFGTF